VKTKREEPFKMVATTFKGLEKVLAREIRELGGQKVRPLVRAVEFYGDTPLLYKTNLAAATALRILKPTAHLRNIRSVAVLYNKIYEIPWETFFHSRKRLWFNVSGMLDTIPDTLFVSQKTKDAIVDRFRDRFGHRPDVDKENPEVVINLHLFRNQITVSLDASGVPLFKRGYRTGAGEAPLNEVMAAGLVRLAKWRNDTHLIDPMTGSGTIPIEAALLASRTAPNLGRSFFSFMHWRDFRPRLLEEIQKELESRRVRPVEFLRIAGYDRDPAMIDIARQNAREAGVDEFVDWEVKNFFETRKIPGPVTLIFNPPYDKRLGLKSREGFYRRMAAHLNDAYRWATAWILSPGDLSSYMGRKPLARYRLLNGKIPVTFAGYSLD